MGDMAKAFGCISISKQARGYEKALERAEDFIRNTLYGEICDEDDGFDEEAVVICFKAPRDNALINYHREDYFRLYSMIGRKCVDGIVKFSDGSDFWCHSFDPETKKWSEHNGHIVDDGLLSMENDSFLAEAEKEIERRNDQHLSSSAR